MWIQLANQFHINLTWKKPLFEKTQYSTFPLFFDAIAPLYYVISVSSKAVTEWLYPSCHFCPRSVEVARECIKDVQKFSYGTWFISSLRRVVSEEVPPNPSGATGTCSFCTIDHFQSLLYFHHCWSSIVHQWSCDDPKAESTQEYIMHLAVG